MAQGDIYFYSGTDAFDRLIQLWTHSKMNHVAIDIGDGTKVEALNGGIERTPVDNATPYRVWSYEEQSKDTDEKDMIGAINWLIGDGSPENPGMVGKKYGWSDVASAADIFNKMIYAVKPGYYDCSALATQFLVKAGGVDLGPLGLDPHLATPASLAKQLGVNP